MLFNTEPLVSVIVPNYNHAKYLEKRMASIFAQSHPSIEIILLDDCSTDDSLEVIKDLGKRYTFELLVNSENSGSTFKQWKKGLSIAKGEYVWIAESDDESEPSFLYCALERLKKSKQASFVFVRSKIIDLNSSEKGDYLTQNRKTDLFYQHNRSLEGVEGIGKYLAFNNIIPNVSSVVFRKSKMPDIDSTCLSLKLLGDWYYYIQCLKTGTLEYISSPLNRYRIHESTVRKNTLKSPLSVLEQLVILQDILKLKDWSFAERFSFFSSFYTRLGYKIAIGDLSFNILGEVITKSARLGGLASILSIVFTLRGLGSLSK